MKITKRLFIIFFALTIYISLFPAYKTFSDDVVITGDFGNNGYFVYKGNEFEWSIISDNTNEIIKIGHGVRYTTNGKTEIVEFPSSIKGIPVKIIGDSCLLNNKNIKEVIIPNSVIRIEDRAFDNCTGLKKITLSKNIKYIGKNAFYNVGKKNDKCRIVWNK